MTYILDRVKCQRAVPLHVCCLKCFVDNKPYTCLLLKCTSCSLKSAPVWVTSCWSWSFTFNSRPVYSYASNPFLTNGKTLANLTQENKHTYFYFQTNKQRNEWNNERRTATTNERKEQRPKQRTNKWNNEWKNERANETSNEKTNEWQMKQRSRQLQFPFRCMHLSYRTRQHTTGNWK